MGHQPDYMQVIKHHDISWVILEQEYYLNHYNVPSYGLESHNYYSLTYKDKREKLIKDNADQMLGTHNYDILKNIIYQDAFQYFPVKIPHGCKSRHELIAKKEADNETRNNNVYQSDLVRLVISLPYMSKEFRDKF